MKKVCLVVLLAGGVIPLTQSGCHIQTSSSFGELSDANALIEGATARELRDVGLDLSAEKATLDQNQADLDKAWGMIEEGPGREGQNYIELRDTWRERARYHTASMMTWSYADALENGRKSPNETNALAIENARAALAATLGAMDASERAFGWSVVATRLGGGQFAVAAASSSSRPEGPVFKVQLKGNEKVTIAIPIESAEKGAQIEFLTDETLGVPYQIFARNPEQGFSLRECQDSAKTLQDCHHASSPIAVKNGSRVQVAGPIGIAQIVFGESPSTLQLVDKPAADAAPLAKDLSRFGIAPTCRIDSGNGVEAARLAFTQAPEEFFIYAAKDFDVAPYERDPKTATIRKDEAFLLTHGQILRANGECFRPIVSNAEVQMAAKEATTRDADLTLIAAASRFTNTRPAKVVLPEARPAALPEVYTLIRDEFDELKGFDQVLANDKAVLAYQAAKVKPGECAKKEWEKRDPNGQAGNWEVVETRSDGSQKVESLALRISNQVKKACNLGAIDTKRKNLRAAKRGEALKQIKARFDKL